MNTNPYVQLSIATIISLLLLCPVRTNGQDLIIVDQNGLGDVTTIQKALLFATEGTTILINPGVYKENIFMPFFENVEIIGTPNMPEATVIDGCNTGPTVTISCDEGASNFFNPLRFQGLTIRNGTDGICIDGDCPENNGLSVEFADCIVEDNTARGIEVNDADIGLENCIIRNNQQGGIAIGIFNFSANLSANGCQFQGNSNTGRGGAIQGSRAGIDCANCTFENNSTTADNGGGAVDAVGGRIGLIQCQFMNNTGLECGAVQFNNLGSDNFLDFVLLNCNFDGNQSSNEAGAVFLNSSDKNGESSLVEMNPTSRQSLREGSRGVTTPMIMDCTFSGNASVDGAGVITINGVEAIVSNCTFLDNTTTKSGGAVQNRNGAIATISNCTFELNRSDAFTFQGGGGAIHNDGSNPLIVDCTFTANSCPINDAGAIYNVNNASPVIQNCMFFGNSSRIDGGAIKNENNCNPMIVDCTFEMNMTTNTAFNAGGAIMSEGSHPMIENCVFIMNASREGGAIFCFDFEPTKMPSQLTVSGCTFTSNASQFGGGAIRAENGTQGTISSCDFISNNGDSGGAISCSNSLVGIDNCEFTSNTALLGDGGAIDFFNGPAVVSACVFENNTANDDGGAMSTNSDAPNVSECIFRFNSCVDNGGALFLNNSTGLVQFSQFLGNNATDLAGAIAGFNGSTSTIVGCSFAGNTCGIDGGATLFSSSSPTSYLSCEFTGNAATNAGGAVVCPGDGHVISNCTFTNNSATVEGGAVLCNSTSNTTINNSILWENDDEIHVADGSTVAVTFSNVQGSFPGTGNMNTDPLFENALGVDGMAGTSDDDLRLMSSSPMIDAGNNDAVPVDVLDIDNDGNLNEPMPFDLRMMVRFADNPDVEDVGNGVGPIVDLGAIEFSEFLLGDVNLDGAVNLLDVGPFIERLSEGVYQAEADCNEDGILNLLDVDPFIAILAN